MRIRTIKPEWLDDERLALASSDARVLSVALILLADDFGNGRANMVVLGSRVFPGKILGTVERAIECLVGINFIRLYTVNGQQYFSIRNWSLHQRVDKPGKPQVPGYSEEYHCDSKIPEAPEKIPAVLATDQDQDQDQDQTHRSDKPSVAIQLHDLESRYGDIAAIHAAREACSLSRQRGSMTDSAWCVFLRQAASHTVQDVEDGCRIMAMKHADGQKNEKYLIGIIRSMLKRKMSSHANGASPHAFFDNHEWGEDDPDVVFPKAVSK